MGFLRALVLYAALPAISTNLLLYLLSYALPPTLASGHPRRLSSFFARCLAYLLSLIVCAIFGITVSLLFRLLGCPGLSQYVTARSFKYVIYVTCGVGFEIEDPEQLLKTRPAVLVGPHQTELDILLLGSVFPPYTSVTSKAELKWMPFLGQFMWASKTVFIDRANSKSARSAFDSAAEEMRRSRQNVWIFPEGTRSYSVTPTLLPFKKGAFHLAVQAQVPIIAVACENYAHVLVLRGGWKKWNFVRGVVRVRVLSRRDTTGLDASAVDRITHETREGIMRAILEMADERHGRKTPVAIKANDKGE